MSSKPAQTTTQTNSSGTKTPLNEQMPMFQDIWGRVGSAVDKTNDKPYGGDFITPATQGQRDAVGMMYGAAPNLGSNAGSLTEMARKISSGYFLDPTNDPTFAAAASAAIDPVTRALQEQVLPGIVDASIRSGGTGAGPAAYGGADQTLKQQGAIKDWTTTAGNITADMAAKSRAAGMALIPQAAGISSAGNQEALLPAMTTAAAGASEYGLNDLVTKNLLAQYTNQLEAPWYGLSQGANVLATGGYGNTTSTGTETKTGSTPDTATQWLQGLTGGAGLLNSLFSSPAGGTSAMSGLMGGLGTAGGWLSSLLPALAVSDRRLKFDITPIGQTYDGQTLYQFRYIADPSRIMIGLMADEVDPEFVYTDEAGYNLVDYNKALRVSRGNDHG